MIQILLEGLLGVSSSTIFKGKGYIQLKTEDDIDKVYEPGVYAIKGTSYNDQTLLVFSHNLGQSTVQFRTNNYGGFLVFRIKWWNGEGPVICIKPTKLKQYYYTLLTVTVYENGYFKKIDLAVYYPVKKGGHKCSMSGNGNMFVKEDSDYNLYIHNKTLNNINYCVSIIGASKYINIPSITVEAHPASVLNGLTLTDVATM